MAAQQCTCKNCFAQFKPKRPEYSTFCSRDCGYEYRKRNANSADIKAAKARARLAAKKKTFSAIACIVCSRQFIPVSITQTKCGPDCRVAHSRERSRLADMVGSGVNKSPRLCVECGEVFAPDYGDKSRHYCSMGCSKRSSRRVRRKKERASLRLAKVEPVNPTTVFNRDGWRCQLCGCSTPRRLRGLNKPSSPELDHILPLSKGGAHSYTNTQCACRSCNGVKGDKPMGQTLLFG